jgi:hypothetical protein
MDDRRAEALAQIRNVERDADLLEAAGIEPERVAPLREHAANARALLDLTHPEPTAP